MKDKHSTIAMCPFFGCDKNKKLSCEGAVFKFADDSCKEELKQKYCYDMNGYQECTVCKILMAYYERLNANL